MNDEISVVELNEKIKNDSDFILIDVREPQEVAVGKIEQSVHIPMGDIPSRLNELDPGKEYVLQCRSGKRSRNVLEFLRQNGFQKLYNLTGGIIAWSEQIDSSVKVG